MQSVTAELKVDFNKTGQARAGCLCPVLSGHDVPRRLLAQHRANTGWSRSELMMMMSLYDRRAVQRGLKTFAESA